MIIRKGYVENVLLVVSVLLVLLTVGFGYFVIEAKIRHADTASDNNQIEGPTPARSIATQNVEGMSMPGAMIPEPIRPSSGLSAEEWEHLQGTDR